MLKCVNRFVYINLICVYLYKQFKTDIKWKLYKLTQTKVQELLLLEKFTLKMEKKSSQLNLELINFLKKNLKVPIGFGQRTTGKIF